MAGFCKIKTVLKMRYLLFAFLFASCQKEISMEQSVGNSADDSSLHSYAANDPRIAYYGRFDFTDPLKPKMWQAAGYEKISFTGSSCTVNLIDQQFHGQHNYVTYLLDYGTPVKVKLTQANTSITVNTTPGQHFLTVAKSTESSVGYIQFNGISTAQLNIPPAQYRKMEFVGDSQTGADYSDTRTNPCGTSDIFSLQDAFMSFGAVAARALNANFAINQASGIGITKLQTGGVKMPVVWDKLCFFNNTYAYKFSLFTPQIVTICLGQNDNLTDSAAYCKAYFDFVTQVRVSYPDAALVLLSSPMSATNQPLSRYLPAIVKMCAHVGNWKTYYYNFQKRYNGGCEGHPSIADHQQIANELTAFIQKQFNW